MSQYKWKIAMYHPKRCKKLALNPREHETIGGKQTKRHRETKQEMHEDVPLEPNLHELGQQSQHD
jgi:hypothetical protein